MTNQTKTQVAEGVEKAIKPEAEADTRDPIVMVRQAMAGNFIQHCVNAAVVDKAENPIYEGTSTALRELLVVILQQGKEQTEQTLYQNIQLIADSIASLNFGTETTLAEQLMFSWAVAAGRSGKLNSLLGQLRDAAEADYRRFLQGNLENLSKLVSVPVAAVESEEVPAPVNETPDVVHQQELDAAKAKAESLPAEAVPVDVEVVPVEA